MHCQGVGCTPWRPLGSASFAWQAWDNVHCQGSDVRPGVPWAPPLLRRRRGTMWIAKALPRGRMYALASLGLRLFCVTGVGQCAFCVAGVGQCALPRGRMYALASLGLRLFCVAGVGQCALPRGRMYALASLGLRLFCVAGVGQCALPRGRMYALASLGLRLFCVTGVGQCALPRAGSDVRPGVPWAPPLLRGRRGTMCIAKGSEDVGSTPWRPLGSASFA